MIDCHVGVHRYQDILSDSLLISCLFVHHRLTTHKELRTAHCPQGKELKEKYEPAPFLKNFSPFAIILERHTKDSQKSLLFTKITLVFTCYLHFILFVNSFDNFLMCCYRTNSVREKQEKRKIFDMKNKFFLTLKNFHLRNNIHYTPLIVYYFLT